MLDFPWLYNHHTIILIYSIVIIYIVWSLCGPTYMQMNFGQKWCRVYVIPPHKVTGILLGRDVSY